MEEPPVKTYVIDYVLLEISFKIYLWKKTLTLFFSFPSTPYTKADENTMSSELKFIKMLTKTFLWNFSLENI